MNYKFLFLLFCTLGLSAGAMELDSGGEVEANILDQAELGDKLFHAIHRGILEKVQQFVPAKISIDWVHRKIGWTPLMMAANHNRPAIVQYLIKLGADLHFRENGWYSPLYLAASVDGWACCEAIIEAMLESLTPDQKAKICAVSFCMEEGDKNTALRDCKLLVVKRLCGEFYKENEKMIIEKIKELSTHVVSEVLKTHLLKKYFPDQQEN